MKIRGGRYFIKEAFRNVFSNGWMSMASILTVVASLLVFGLFMILSINVSYFAEQIEADYEIIVMVDETVGEDRLAAIGEEIRNIPNVQEVVLNPNDQRLADLKEDLGEDASVLDGYEEDNPLRDWYMVTMESLDLAEQTAAQLEQISGVAKIARNQDTINTLVTVTDSISNISIWVMLALAIVSVFIISNTIKLTVFARRKEINIMKFVGATDWFIRWPFVIEGVIIGFFGCIISLLILGFAYNGLLGMVENLGITFVKFVPLSRIWLTSSGLFALMGILLGGIGSLISVRKYLKV